MTSCTREGKTEIEMRPMLGLGIGGYGVTVTRTVLLASLVQELVQPFVEECGVPFIALFRRHVHIADQWYLRSSGSIGRSVTKRERDAQLLQGFYSPHEGRGVG